MERPTRATDDRVRYDGADRTAAIRLDTGQVVDVSAKIIAKPAPGVYQMETGAFRVRVSIGDRKRGVSRETTFPKGTALRKMTDWQTTQRAALLRQRLVPTTGTLQADIPRYLDTLANNPETKKDRKRELAHWVARFGGRRRHTITRDEIRQQIKQ